MLGRPPAALYYSAAITLQHHASCAYTTYGARGHYKITEPRISLSVTKCCKFTHSKNVNSFQEKRPIKIKDLATLKRLVAVIGRPVPCTARLASRRTDRQTDRQTDRPSTVTLAAHARRGLTTHPSTTAAIYFRFPV